MAILEDIGDLLSHLGAAQRRKTPPALDRLGRRAVNSLPDRVSAMRAWDDGDHVVENLWEVFAAIRRVNLRLHSGKCNLLRRKTTFLGHVICTESVATDLAKVATVKDWPTPENMSFLGCGVSWDLRHITGALSEIWLPSHARCTSSPRRDGNLF